MADSIAESIENMELDDGNSGGTAPGGAKDSAGGSDGAAKDQSGATDENKSGTRPEGDGAGDTGTEGGDADEEGYIADELDDDDGGDDVEPEPTGTPDFTPEMKYIVDNLPTLSVRGKATPNGTVRTFNVKAAGQLPDTFEFASKREEMLFTQQIAAQELKAQQLQTQFQSQQQQRQTQQYSQQENADIRSDIASLQREGLLPKFKYAPNDRKFESDPAVKAAQEVMDFMNERNSEYVRDKKLYRISFRDAYRMMERESRQNDANNRQNQEDRERRTVTRRLAGAGSAPTNSGTKARPARSTEDLLARLDTLDFN